MERKIKIFVQKDVKIKLIRGKGQKTYESFEYKCPRLSLLIIMSISENQLNRNDILFYYSMHEYSSVRACFEHSNFFKVKCLQKEWLESKCSQKCSPTAHCIVEGPQKFAKIRSKGQKVYECSQKYSLSAYHAVEDPKNWRKCL